VLVAWLQGRAGRKVRLKFGDIEVEGRTSEDLKRLLELIDEHKAKPSSAADGEQT
jgi:hypothetical protein